MPQPRPLRILLICPDANLREQARGVFADLGSEVVLTFVLDTYPSGTELARALRTFSPQVVFLSFEQVGTGIAVMRFLESEAERLPVVGLHGLANQALLRDAMRAGAREFLTPPFRIEEVAATLQSMRALLRQAPLAYTATDHIYSFLPAKPGVGTSTVALNLSAAMAREPETTVLLGDLDLTCGIIRFLLKLPQDLSIVDALPRAAEMDVSLWPKLVSHRDGFDILHSGGINPHAYLDPPQVQGLIDFARGAYSALLFDMSGNMERHSLQVMQESKRVFLVCNPEAGSLFLGREKVQFLNRLGLGDRTSVILNRADQALAVPAESVAKFLGVPLAATLSDDTFECNRAVGEARSVVTSSKGKRSKLAREYQSLAQSLLRASHRETEGQASLPEKLLAVA